MAAYDADNSIRRIVYIIVNFDDNLHQYDDDYSVQIDSFIYSKSYATNRNRLPYQTTLLFCDRVTVVKCDRFSLQKVEVSQALFGLAAAR